MGFSCSTGRRKTHGDTFFISPRNYSEKKPVKHPPTQRRLAATTSLEFQLLLGHGACAELWKWDLLAARRHFLSAFALLAS